MRDVRAAINPELADRVELYDRRGRGAAAVRAHHIHEQVHKALDRKVWLPSGGSLIIEHTEALTVIDVNTGKNVARRTSRRRCSTTTSRRPRRSPGSSGCATSAGSSSSTSSTWRSATTASKVIEAFRDALARDKTRTQVFDISELGLVEMTRKRIGEGLLDRVRQPAPNCEGRGVVIDPALLE